ncbi:Sensory transduction protein regX3 [Bacteroidales bacterium Barb4]|nr:Sensory transduction protein regX3 [Bacteroidales bacterium Barb4]
MTATITQSPANVLVHEPDVQTGFEIRDRLTVDGVSAVLVADSGEIYNEFVSGNYALCVISLAGAGGAEAGFCAARRLKQIRNSVFIIFTGEKPSPEMISRAFLLEDTDDFLRIPFHTEELSCRIQAILRRKQQGTGLEKRPAVYKIGKYTFDPLRQELTIANKMQKLTTKESELLRILCINGTRLTTRKDALETIWKGDTYFNARSMDVYVTKLRKMLSKDSTIHLINVHAEGYRFVKR